ncbi:ester cyclase [Haladaptatus sp. YSMS36]|uniref:ester cyclase n=1 Tax=Haladaptatus sp. YSMS36 TaxID=3033384 RepID=UPI0023E87335|nr:ester cyclase [Haladaptatus sp. YSMS36]
MAVPASENERILTRIATEVWSEGKMDVLKEVMADDVGGQLPGVGDLHTREDYERAVEAYRTAFPDFTVDFQELIPADDVVTMRYTVRGTHDGEMMGIAPTGNKAEMQGSTILRFKDGKVVEEWNYGDMSGLLQQLGAM